MHVGTFARSHCRPVFVEEFNVTPVGFVMGFGFKQIEEPHRKIQDVLSAGRQIELAHSVECKRLAIKMLSGL
jgi:hypothetical protein